jgi:hypothetical protein
MDPRQANVEDLYAQFKTACRSGRREEGTNRLLQALIAHDARAKEQDVEKEHVGLNRLHDRSEACCRTIIDIEKAIEKHAEASVLAVAASLVIRIELDDDEDYVLQTYRASLWALRPQLIGAMAEDADRVLAQNEEASS